MISHINYVSTVHDKRHNKQYKLWTKILNIACSIQRHILANL